MNSYDRGTMVRLWGTLKDRTDTELDASTVVFQLRRPNGLRTTYTYGVDPELVRDGTGVYYVDVILDVSGQWRYRFSSTGTGHAARESALSVNRSFF